MIITVIGFLFGNSLFQIMPYIPTPWWVAGALPLSVYFLRFRSLRILTGIVLGFSWMLLYAWWHAPEQLPKDAFQENARFSGEIIEIPIKTEIKHSFFILIDELEFAGKEYSGRWKFRLNWYHPTEALVPGDKWEFSLRLRRVHGFMNPGGFDYEGWLYRQGVIYNGSVLAGRKILPHTPSLIARLDRLRHSISQQLSASIDSATAAAIIKALVVGDRSAMSTQDRRIFAQTGTSHLMAISGLHIGLIAGLFFFVVNWGWRRIPKLCRRTPAAVAATVFALPAALVYAALAGFSVPTQRAFIMLFLLVAGTLSRRKVDPFHYLSATLFGVLVIDPFSVLSAGFWLSFSAVAVIFLLAKRGSPNTGYLRRWFWLQIAILIGLAPVLLSWDMNVALSAPVVNLLAIPWFGFLVIPLSLFGTILMLLELPVHVYPLEAAAWMVDIGLGGLRWVAANTVSFEIVSSNSLVFALMAAAGVFLLFMPRGFPAKYLGLFLLLPLLFPKTGNGLKGQGDYYFTLLDVGQGLAASIETANHSLIFDTGPRFRSGFNTGEAVIAPYLRSRGITEIDKLIVSHSDTDHSGGAHGLSETVHIKDILTGETLPGSHLQASGCYTGQSWQWDGVDFEILYPARDHQLEGNNASCVLRISGPAGSVLLTGDIEKSAEKSLTEQYRRQLQADVVVVPHHGSRTSSSADFISATRPVYALFAAGYANRWGFPKEAVAQRWKSAGASTLNTAEEGAIQFYFSSQGVMSDPSSFRRDQYKYWNHLVSPGGRFQYH